LCRELKLFSQAVVAVDGSKFKAVNARDRNFTPGKVQKRQEQIEESIKRYLDALDTADRTQAPTEFQAKAEHLQDKLRTMREQMRRMQGIEQHLKHEPDGQLSLTDPDAGSMATSGRGSGIVGYNVQVAVDAKHHLIVAHEVTNSAATGTARADGGSRTRGDGQEEASGRGRSRVLQRPADQGMR